MKKRNKKMSLKIATGSVVRGLIIGFTMGFTILLLMAINLGPSSVFLLRNPMSVLLYTDAYKIDNNIRDIALNITNGCYGSQDCVILELYDNLSSTLVYSNTPYDRYTDKYQVLREKSGDCKSMSGLYVNLAINVGVKAYLDTNLEYRHVVAIAEPRDKDYYYMIDLTVPEIQRFGKGQDHWKLRFEQNQGLAK